MTDESQGFDTLIGSQKRIDDRATPRSPLRHQQEESAVEGQARLMATPKNRTSRSRTRSRRAHWKTETPQLATVTTPDGRTVQVPLNLAAAARRGYMHVD